MDAGGGLWYHASSHHQVPLVKTYSFAMCDNLRMDMFVPMDTVTYVCVFVYVCRGVQMKK